VGQQPSNKLNVFSVSAPVSNEHTNAAAEYLVEEYKGAVVRGILITFGKAFTMMFLV